MARRKNPAIMKIAFEFIDDVVDSFVNLLRGYMIQQRNVLGTWNACIDVSDLTPDDYGTAVLAQKRYDIPLVNGQILQGYLCVYTQLDVGIKSRCFSADDSINLFKDLKLHPQTDSEWEQFARAYSRINATVMSAFVENGEQLSILIKTSSEINLWKHLLEENSPQLILFKQHLFSYIHHELIHIKEFLVYRDQTIKGAMKYNKHVVAQYMKENNIQDIDELELDGWDAHPDNSVIYYNSRTEVRAFLANIFWQLRDKIINNPELLKMPVEDLLWESNHYAVTESFLLNKNKKLIHKATARWLKEDLDTYLGRTRFLPRFNEAENRRQKALQLIFSQLGDLSEEIAYLESLPNPSENDEKRIKEIEQHMDELSEKIVKLNQK